MKTVKICWNHAKILPAAVVATGPEDAVLNELAALLLPQLQRPLGLSSGRLGCAIQHNFLLHSKNIAT